ncbi:hypothetical protein C1645_841620 [Glomus cerebriforme]|uniref:Uncharacterized protein n=1 Tax=Glomus cerebriforme TaxID=658196 RepID=A0A397RXZ7_9GLOM|nr:hypothetical protein C1645_841620 [Glomus cerebriforme]
MCDFMANSHRARRKTEDEFDRICNINTLNRRQSRGNGNIIPTLSTRDVEHELRSSERCQRQSHLVPEKGSSARDNNNDNIDISNTECEE